MSNYKKIFPLTQEMSDIAKKIKWIWSSNLKMLNWMTMYWIGTTPKLIHDATSTPVLLKHEIFKKPFAICVPKTVSINIINQFLSDTIDQDRNILYVIVFRTFCVLTLSLDIPSHFNYTCKNVFMTDLLHKTKNVCISELCMRRRQCSLKAMVVFSFSWEVP